MSHEPTSADSTPESVAHELAQEAEQAATLVGIVVDSRHHRRLTWAGKLRAFRRARGLRLKDVAAAFGVSVATIKSWESSTTARGEFYAERRLKYLYR